MGALGTILKDNWEWRGQIVGLAVFELKKRARGAALGWVWLIAKPVVFIVVFWFALEVGLRAGSTDPDANYPYFVWLVSGIIPWFFMSDMLNTGSDVLHRYPYLVTKVKFPLSGISSLYALSSLFINAMLIAALMIIYTGYGMPWDVYLVQVPVLLLVMVVFWDAFSILFSQLSAMSKDIGQLMKALSQPLFWLSGILFNIDVLNTTGFSWVGDLMLFNPVTFFATAFRDATCYKVWVWEDPAFIGGFGAVFLATVVLMCVAYGRLSEEVPDVL